MRRFGDCDSRLAIVMYITLVVAVVIIIMRGS